MDGKYSDGAAANFANMNPNMTPQSTPDATKGKVCATVSFCAQVGIDQWRDINRSRVFPMTSTLVEILEWANRGRSNPETFHGICDVKFSDVEES